MRKWGIAPAWAGRESHPQPCDGKDEGRGNPAAELKYVNASPLRKGSWAERSIPAGFRLRAGFCRGDSPDPNQAEFHLRLGAVRLGGRANGGAGERLHMAVRLNAGWRSHSRCLGNGICTKA